MSDAHGRRPADGAEPPTAAGNAPGGNPAEPTTGSDKAPAARDPFRPAGDPELQAPPPPPTSLAWGAEPGTLPGEHDDAAAALVIGEALIDIVERPGEEPVEHPGGSPANVAVGLARLGRDVELVSWFGADAHGSVLRSHLELENVRLSAASARAGHTSTARARLGPTVATDDRLIVAGDRVELDPRFDRDCTGDVNARAVSYCGISRRPVH